MNKLKLAVFLSLLLLSSLVSAQPSVSPECREKFQNLNKSISEEMEQAESDEERNQLRKRYESKMKELEDECLKQNENEDGETRTSSSGDRPSSDRRLERTEDLRKAQPEGVSDENCQEKTEKLKEKYVEEIKESSSSELLEVIERFGGRTAEELNRCGAAPSSGSRDTSGGEQHSELSISLGEGIPDECRSRVEILKEKYEERLSNTEGSEKDQIINQYHSKVEDRLESCKAGTGFMKQGENGLQLPNVSEAPEGIPEKCKEKIGQLNEKVRKELENADNKTKVREKYRSEYKSAMRGCMKGMVVEKTKNKIASNLMDKLPIGSNKEKGLTQKLQRKNEKIERLQERVDELENRLSEHEEVDETNYSDKSSQEAPQNNLSREEDVGEPALKEKSNAGSQNGSGPVRKVLGSILG